MNKAMDESNDEGTVPGWTLSVALLGWLIAPMLLWACRDFGLPWIIGVPAAIAVAVAGSLAERWLDNKYSVNKTLEGS